MKIAVLGGDGFCGWPSALHLASEGHAVTIIDNLSRRTIAEQLSAPSLTPIRTIEERILAAQAIGDVRFKLCDIARQPDRFKSILADVKPDVVVHFAEQRSAPYSMISGTERQYTVNNNVTGTNNLMSNLVELNLRPHIVHLGTMGVYGYNADFGEIPEGYLDVTVKNTGCEVSIPYPGNPGSIYHLTKVLDHQMMQFYAKNWGFRITDLHQGIVWGTETNITRTDPALINRFDYDGEYGTVLNRMICQAQIGFPLTVYGSGGQTRAFIHISDTARCIALACNNPPEAGARPQVFNQIAEVHTVRDLAEMISQKTGTEVKNIENPRKEAAENTLTVSNQGLRSLGFEPVLLDKNLVCEIADTVGTYARNLDKNVIISRARW
ncbi:MAG: NAD-dependent epimerase/dehydratase family protein [Aliishimia sp.]